MADLNLQHKINVPFAQNGDKDEIPDTSAEGFVNNTDGLGVKYETPIGQGGEYYTREIINGALYKVYAAVKELQDLAITAGFPVDMTNALNVLSLSNGGTGANNAMQARSNLGLGTLATKSTITSADITDGTITSNDIANNAVTTSKLADTAVTANKLASSAVTNAKIANNTITGSKIANNTITGSKIANNTIDSSNINGPVTIPKGGTGRNDGIATGINYEYVINADNWQTITDKGLFSFFWSENIPSSKNLPFVTGYMLLWNSVPGMKSALALDPINNNISYFNPQTKKWKRLAFYDDVKK